MPLIPQFTNCLRANFTVCLQKQAKVNEFPDFINCFAGFHLVLSLHIYFSSDKNLLGKITFLVKFKHGTRH